jgi:hypothetical protein
VSALCDQLRQIADNVIAEHAEDGDLSDVSPHELYAEIGLVAWQENVGTFRQDIPPANGNVDDGYDPRWRRTVIDRVRKRLHDQVADATKVVVAR